MDRAIIVEQSLRAYHGLSRRRWVRRNLVAQGLISMLRADGVPWRRAWTLNREAVRCVREWHAAGVGPSDDDVHVEAERLLHLMEQ